LPSMPRLDPGGLNSLRDGEILPLGAMAVIPIVGFLLILVAYRYVWRRRSPQKDWQAVQSAGSLAVVAVGSRLTKVSKPKSQPAEKPSVATSRRETGGLQLSTTTRVELHEGSGGASAMLSQPRRTPPPNMPPPGFFPVVPFPMLPPIPLEARNWNPGQATRQPTTVSYLPNYAEPDGEDDNSDDPVNFPSAMPAPSAVEYLPNYISPSTIEYLPNYNEELPDDDEEYDDDDDIAMVSSMKTHRLKEFRRD